MDALLFIGMVAGMGYGPVALRAAYVAVLKRFHHYDYTPRRTGLINCGK